MEWRRREADQPGSDQPAEKVYWGLATLAEAALGLGDEQGCRRWMDAAKGMKPAPAPWMIDSTENQLSELRNLIRLADEKGIRLASTPPRDPK